jgi:hypothetical protein
VKTPQLSLAIVTVLALGSSAYAQNSSRAPVMPGDSSALAAASGTAAPVKPPPKLKPSVVEKLAQVPDLMITELSANVSLNAAVVVTSAIKLCNNGAQPANLNQVTLSGEFSGGPRAYSNISLAKYGTGGRPFEGTLAAGACATADTYVPLPFGPDRFDPPAEGDTFKLSVSYSGAPAEVATDNNSKTAILHVPANDTGARMDVKSASAQWDATNKKLSVTFQVCNRGYGRLAQGKVGASFLVPLPGSPNASAGAFDGFALGQDVQVRQCLTKTVVQSLANSHYGTPTRTTTGLWLYVYDQPPTQMPAMYASYPGQTYFPGAYGDKKFENLFPPIQLPN